MNDPDKIKVYSEDSIKKIIIAKYPCRLGYHLLQEFYDLTKMNVNQLKKLYQLENDGSENHAEEEVQNQGRNFQGGVNNKSQNI